MPAAWHVAGPFPEHIVLVQSESDVQYPGGVCELASANMAAHAERYKLRPTMTREW